MKFKKMFTSLRRILKSGWENFLRDKETIFPTIFVLLIAIFLASSILFLKDVGSFLITSIKEKADISVYFKEGVSEEEILKVKEDLLKNPEVKNVEYISREETLQRFIQRYKDNPNYMESLEMVGGNPFLAALNIKVFEASQYAVIEKFFEKKEINSLIDHQSYPQSKIVIEKIFSLTSFVERIGIFLAILFLVIAVLVNLNTIRLAIYNSREEIKIQRLVGASNWFIRGPFLVQGAMAGIFAALICLLVFGLIIWIFSPKVEIFFPGLNIFQFFVSNFWIIVLIQLATGISLGVISSTLAIRKYLKG